MPEDHTGKSDKDDKKPGSSIEHETINDSLTDEAVDEITKNDSYEVLETEDRKRFKPVKLPWYKKLFAKKKVWIPSLIVFILIVLGAVPFTRYKLAGLVLNQNYSIRIVDAQTNLPVSSAEVSVAGKSAETNNQGIASLKVKVGQSTLVISKKYYKNLSQTVLIGLRSSGTHSYAMLATGRQVPLKVVNLINSQPIDNALITAAGTTSRTNSHGQTTMVLPADKSNVSVTISANNFNSNNSVAQITTAVVTGNTFHLTPSGQVYFLSNASGTIDVVSTNLDGTNRQTVLAGTGNENQYNTSLYPSPDWQYLVLDADRTAGAQGNNLYLINTANQNLTTINSNSSDIFNIVGWGGDDFIYTATNNNGNPWQSGNSTLESYNAVTGKQVTIDQTSAVGTSTYDYAQQIFDQTYITGDTVVYCLSWQSDPYSSSELQGKNNSILSASLNGEDKKDLQDVPVPADNTYNYINSRFDGPQTIYFQVPNSSDGSSNQYYLYSNGTISQPSSYTLNDFQQPATGYIGLSPNGQTSLYSQTRDGQLALLTGDSTGGNQQPVATLPSEFNTAYWYNNNYILAVKNSDQLYILPATGLSGSTQPLKITNFFSSPGGY